MSISRRFFLKQAGAITLGFTGLQSIMVASGGFSSRFAAQPESGGYGPLKRDPDGIFDLPEGFRYTIISRHGETMDDGLRLPHRPDGMAAFPGSNRRTVLIRNHEVSAGADPEEGPFDGRPSNLLSQIPASSIYDPGRGTPALGGTTNLVYDTRRQEVISQHLSLAGTIRNCAGGPTPWNTWITCEETVQRADDRHEVDHGYVFEVTAHEEPRLVHPVPIKSMGRFNHEAVAVDPDSGVIYLTEDRGDGLLYRWIPNRPGDLLAGGRLQALVVRDHASMDTRNWGDGPDLVPGDRFEVTWMDLENIDAPDDDLRLRGFDQGATRFARGEGMWFGNGAVYFACTNGGDARKGQIWSYTPSPNEGTSREEEQPGVLELFVEPNDATVIENADNLTVSPWGDLIVCEDGSGEQYLVGVTPEGELYKFGRNAMNGSELAGATFSPDGSTLFFNIMSGLTLAVTGPWKSA